MTGDISILIDHSSSERDAVRDSTPRAVRLHRLIAQTENRIVLIQAEGDSAVNDSLVERHLEHHQQGDRVIVHSGSERSGPISFSRKLYDAHSSGFQPGLEHFLYFEWTRRMQDVGARIVREDLAESEAQQSARGRELSLLFQCEPGRSHEFFGFDIGTPGRMDELLAASSEEKSIHPAAHDAFVAALKKRIFEREKLCYLDRMWRTPKMTVPTTHANRFVFILPTFNMAGSIERTLQSIAQQTYPNWKVMIADDMSEDGTVDRIREVISALHIEDKVELHENTERVWALENCLRLIRECQSDDIICRIDGDDWLCDLDALTLINEVYADCAPDVLWTKNRFGFSGHNRSGPLAEDVDVYSAPWLSTHFRTFRKSLFDSVPDGNFRDQEGNYFRRVEDQALMLPLLHLAERRFFLPVVAYHYSCERDEVSDEEARQYQADIARFIRERGFVDG